MAKITANEQALTALETEYQAELAELEQAVKDNEKAIANLNAKYLEDVAKIQSDITAINEQIKANKTALENQISQLKSFYDAKFVELNGIIETLKTTDSSQQEIIESLIDRVVELEKGMQIKDITIAENGNITIYFTDGTSKTIEKPQGHVHTFGDLIVFGNVDNTCENKMFYRVCSGCAEIQFKHGTYADHDWNIETIGSTCQSQGYDHKTCKICEKEEKVNYQPISDHIWQTTYLTDNSFHWIKCNDCDEIKDNKEHTADDSGYCTVCDAIVGATVGVVYDLSGDGTYAEVIGYEGSAKRIILASEYQNKPVKSIYGNVFTGSDITSIVIPDTITSIGDSAFESCTSLISVTVGNGVTSIGEKAFYKCNKLTNINIPSCVTTIDNHAFAYCKSLKSVVIPDSVTSIGKLSFYDCTSLTSLTIGNGITRISDGAFKSCTVLTSVIIPDSVTSMGELSFGWCYLLESVTLGSGLTSIGVEAFSACRSLKSIDIPNSVTSIGNSAFSGCLSLSNVTMGNSETKIGSSVFYNCSSLIYTTENSLKYLKINDNPFYILIEAVNKNLSSYIINGQTKYIANSAFSDCSRFANIYFNGDVNNWVEISGLSNIMSAERTLYINNEKPTEIVLDSATKISSCAFAGCSSLTSVTIGNNVTSIGVSAFRGCSSLTSIEIPDSVTSIDYYAFANCSSLTSVTIGSGVTSLGEDVFYECPIEKASIPAIACSYVKNSSLKEVIITSGTSIEAQAFDCSVSLTSVIIGDSVTSIGYEAFNLCGSLKSVTIGNGVTTIGGFAFHACSVLENVTIGKGVTSIGEWTFGWCYLLTTIKYRGSEEQWSAISKGEDWDYTDSKTKIGIIYNYTGE